MAYRLVKSDEGTDLMSVESVEDNMIVPLTTTTTETAASSEQNVTPECLEKVLVDFHKFMQLKVKEHQDSEYDEDSKPFDLESFLSSLSDRMTQTMNLVKKEGLVGLLDLESKLPKLCQSLINGDTKVNRKVLNHLLGEVSKLLHEVRPVDVDLLLDMLKANKDAGDTLKGKNVLLLIGQTGCGKTSTIHYLAGSSFKEVFVDGSEHLEITKVAHPSLLKAETSSSTRSVTKSILSIDVETEEGGIVTIADTPGFGDTDGVETEIANGYGMVMAVRGANRVKPVFTLSRNGVGDRLEVLSQTLHTITRLVTRSGDDGKVDPTPFAYVFTKYDLKYKCHLHEKFKRKLKELTDSEREDEGFVAFIRDIIEKTDPKANLVLPLNEENRSTLLSSLMEGEWYKDPSTSFSKYTSKQSLQTLTVQLQLTFTSIRRALDRKDSYFVLTKLCQLVELENHLPLRDVASHVMQSIDVVSGFLKQYERSLASSIDKCKRLRGDRGAFKRELESVKEYVEVLVDFLPVVNKWASFQQSIDTPPLEDTNFCHQSITDLTNSLEENILSLRRSRKNFVSRLRKQKKEAITDLICLKEVADLEVADVFTSTKKLYQECTEALVASIVGVLEGTCKLVSARPVFQFGMSQQSFMPETSLISLRADFDIFSIIHQLQDDGVELGDDVFIQLNQLWLSAGDEFVLNLQNEITAVVKQLSSVEQDTKTLIGNVNRQSISDVKRILCFLVKHPELAASLRQMDADVATKNLNDVESAVASFVTRLVDKVDAEFDDARKVDDEESIQDIKQYLPDIDDLFAFCQTISSACDDQGKIDIAVIALKVDDYMKSLSAKHRTVLNRAEHYLSVIKTQDLLTHNVLKDIATDWDKWEEALAIQTKVPKKKQKPRGMFNRLRSAFGLTESSSPRESKFALRLKGIMDDIGQELRCRLESSFQSPSSPSSILLFVNIIAIEDTAFIASAIKPVDYRYKKAQGDLSTKIIECFHCVNIKTGDFDAINKALDRMKEETETWRDIKESVKRIRPKNNTQQELCHAILAVEDYPSQCQSLIEQVRSIKSDFIKISFLDDEGAFSKNEHVRNAFYRKVACSLSQIEKLHILQRHLSVDVAFDVNSMWQEAVDHVVHQIKSIHEHLYGIMMKFPNIKDDFQKLYVWRSSLHSIERCFQAVEPKLSGSARRFRDEIDREKTLALESIESPTAEKLIPLLLLLKKASNNIPSWRQEINQAIDKLLLSMSKSASNCGRFILGIQLSLKNVEDNYKDIALQIISEHKCFEGAMNAVFNAATASQGIEYVLESIGLSDESSKALRSMYAAFLKQYNILIEGGLLASNSGSMTTRLQALVDEAKATAIDYSVDYRSQITRLATLIFAYWSLKNRNSFVTGNMTDDEIHGAVEYLKKPHAAQVVSIWCLLNFEHQEYRKLKNHFVEILTGEGKSITLGVTGIILAMLDCNVMCICYSEYLSSRDYNAFKSMFDDFGVSKSIKYSTLKDACEEVLYNRGVDTRSLTNDIAWDRKTKCVDSDEVSEKVQVLIVDEADVLLDKNFHGDSFRSCTSLRHTSITELLKYIWEHRDTLDQSSLSESSIAQTCINLFPADMQPIISKQIDSMLRDAKNVETHDYIVWEGKICYKEMDGISSRTVSGYSTAFAGIKEYENNRIEKEAMEGGLCISLSCGQSSYAEMPNVFDIILGVTGTLSSLNQNEKAILSQYGIDQFTFVPSVYGNKRLMFACDSPQDVMISDDDANFHLDLRNEINTRRKPKDDGYPLRAVMIFFESRKEAEDFYESVQMRDLKSHVRVLTEEIALEDKEGTFLQSTKSGAITLMIREYGRGTDFVCHDERMLKGGGVHVIQAFFSTEISEEIQIKGRTARQGARGSYSLVLHKESLLRSLKLKPSDIESMCRESKVYARLDSKRLAQYTDTLKKRKVAVDKVERLHYETIDYKQCALNNKRKEAIPYLENMNGVKSTTPNLVKTKASFVAEKLKRIVKQEEVEKTKRFEAKSKEDLISQESIEEDEFFDASDNLEEDEVPIVNEDSTHYDILVVSSTATVLEINQAYRQESLKYHPDKNNNPRAIEYFHRLSLAKEVLSNTESRQSYDDTLS